YGVQPARRVELRVAGASEGTRQTIGACRRMLADLARVEEVSFGGANGEAGASAVLRSGAELFIPLAGVIDLEKERARLRAELERLEGQVKATEGRLANESFVDRAPAEVVQREREKLGSFAEQRDKLAATLRSLESTP